MCFQFRTYQYAHCARGCNKGNKLQLLENWNLRECAHAECKGELKKHADGHQTPKASQCRITCPLFASLDSLAGDIR